MSRRLMVFIAWVLLASGTLRAEPGFSGQDRNKVIENLKNRLKPVMGKEWDSLYATYKARLSTAGSSAEFYGVIRRMFAATNKSHFVMAAPQTQALEAAGTDFSGRSGISAGLVENELMILNVKPQSPASALGLQAGTVIETFNGVAMKPFIHAARQSSHDPHKQRLAVKRQVARWLTGPAGRKLTLQLRSVDNRRMSKELTLETGNGVMGKMGHLPSELMEFESRRLAEGTIGYIRFNIFMMPLLGKIKKAITSFSECTGIILDLRGNPGGLGMMAMPIAGMFVDKQIELGESKSGKDIFKYPVFPTRKPYRGKLVILTDEMSASTSEIFAAGLQEYGRAEVVGNQTMGAVLPSLIIKLETGATIQYPIGDFKTPKGVSLEGRGVIPDHLITFSRDYLKSGGDSVLKKAISIIKEK